MTSMITLSPKGRGCGWALTLLLAACAPAAEQPPPAPALWTLADADTKIHLLGTIHALPRGTAWRTPAIERAVGEASALVLEVDPEEIAGADDAMKRFAFSGARVPVASRVPADKRVALDAAIVASGVPPQVFDGMDTWAVALTLATAQMLAGDVNPSSGVDRALSRDFSRAKKPVYGLETVAQQLGIFDALPEAEQRRFLVGVIDERDDWDKEFAAMLASWRRGDVDAIAKTFDEDLRESPALAAALLTRRNAAWAAWLARRMEQPGTIMVAVGAGHLAGPGSVQAMLAARGLAVKRVQ